MMEALILMMQNFASYNESIIQSTAEQLFIKPAIFLNLKDSAAYLHTR